jgi:hypothetical protein
MSLLCAKVDTVMICLLGPWHSDEMLLYLHAQTFPLVMRLAKKILHNGHCSFMSNQPLRGIGEATGTIQNSPGAQRWVADYY